MVQNPFNLQRFVEAQARTFDTAFSEMREGRKRSHWMWFIFPQLRGLGRTPTAQFYGVASLEEARAYLAHPLLGPRLEEVTQAVLATHDRSVQEIFGSPDDRKFHSSMTLFAIASPRQDRPFRDALDRWFAARMDAGSLALLGISVEEDLK
ncbi:DUF1810 domain-containing protein [Bosea sp. PAMC 26642]|uniref:DUF1810 domain-containing protein n=1 Tax=Bosea sp. (strain PAMC 26642) TaxID=1792307 RepID=UPI00076FF4E7|nr:DUF1810 domain-containing protein [Bosea sp. PAMC 26642]AMJ63929.1 calpastatin [Bosea sp. PAMC 26642]